MGKNPPGLADHLEQTAAHRVISVERPRGAKTKGESNA